MFYNHHNNMGCKIKGLDDLKCIKTVPLNCSGAAEKLM